jgi:hypothetical protein
MVQQMKKNSKAAAKPKVELTQLEVAQLLRDAITAQFKYLIVQHGLVSCGADSLKITRDKADELFNKIAGIT